MTNSWASARIDVRVPLLTNPEDAEGLWTEAEGIVGELDLPAGATVTVTLERTRHGTPDPQWTPPRMLVP